MKFSVLAGLTIFVGIVMVVGATVEQDRNYTGVTGAILVAGGLVAWAINEGSGRQKTNKIQK